MATITQVKGRYGKVAYRARVRIKGRPIQSAAFPSLKDAEQWVTKYAHLSQPHTRSILERMTSTL